MKTKGILSYTVTIICVDGYRVTFTLTVDPTTNTLTFSIVVKPFQLYFAKVTVTNKLGSVCTNSSEVASPSRGMFIQQKPFQA